jgi:hypothetical protein
MSVPDHRLISERVSLAPAGDEGVDRNVIERAAWNSESAQLIQQADGPTAAPQREPVRPGPHGEEPGVAAITIANANDLILDRDLITIVGCHDLFEREKEAAATALIDHESVLKNPQGHVIETGAMLEISGKRAVEISDRFVDERAAPAFPVVLHGRERLRSR